MAKLYLLGGENVAKRNAREVNERAFEDAGGTPTVLVFSWARPSFDRKFARKRMVHDYLRSLGARAVDFADFSDPLELIASKMAHSDLVYLTGGQLSTLINRLKNSSVDSVLREYKGVIVGRSAGALAFAKKGVVTNRYSCAVKMVDGLGFVDFSLKTHYKPADDVTLEKLARTEKIYAVPERSGLVYDDGDLSFMGKLYLFEKGEKQEL